MNDAIVSTIPSPTLQEVDEVTPNQSGLGLRHQTLDSIIDGKLAEDDPMQSGPRDVSDQQENRSSATNDSGRNVSQNENGGPVAPSRVSESSLASAESRSEDHRRPDSASIKQNKPDLKLQIPALRVDTDASTGGPGDRTPGSAASRVVDIKTPLTSVTKRRWWIPEKPTFYQQIVNTVKDTLGMTLEERGEWMEEITTTTQAADEAIKAQTHAAVDESDESQSQKNLRMAIDVPLPADADHGLTADDSGDSYAAAVTASVVELDEKRHALHESHPATAHEGNAILWDIRKLTEEDAHLFSGHRGDSPSVTPVSKIQQQELLRLAIRTPIPQNSIEEGAPEPCNHKDMSPGVTPAPSNGSERDIGEAIRMIPQSRKSAKVQRLLEKLPKISVSTSQHEATAARDQIGEEQLQGATTVNSSPAERTAPAHGQRTGSSTAVIDKPVTRPRRSTLTGRVNLSPDRTADSADGWTIKVAKRPKSDQTFSQRAQAAGESLQGFGQAPMPSSPQDLSSRRSSRSGPADRLLRRINRSTSLRAAHFADDLDRPRVARRARAATGPLARASILDYGAWQSEPPDPVGPSLEVEPTPVAPSSREEVIDEGYNSPDDADESFQQVFLTMFATVQEGLGRTIQNSPLSPSRPSSLRQRRSIENLEQDKVQQDILAARRSAEQLAHSREAELHDRDFEIQRLKSQIGYYNAEYEELKKKGDSLKNQVSELNTQLATARSQQEEEQQQRQRLQRAHDELQMSNERLSNDLDKVKDESQRQLADKEAEIAQLRDQLVASKAKVKELQKVISDDMKDGGVAVRPKEYFEKRCQELCQHIRAWTLRFSKHSDKRACRSIAEIHDGGISKRFATICLDDTNVDTFLLDRVRRRDAFMAVVSAMIWENVFNRYLFGMDREQRNRLRTLEKRLSEVGPRRAVQKWRSITLSILVKHAAFERLRKDAVDTTAQDIYHTLSRLLPPPADKQATIIESLKVLIRLAADIAIEMRLQRAEYVMTRPSQSRRNEDAGAVADKVYFDASVMNNASTSQPTANEQLEQEQAVVQLVLFPMVVKRSNDDGDEDDEVVVSPAQVLVASEPVAKDKKPRVISSQQSLGQVSRPSAYSSMEEMR
ncbi:hypothetical protein KEM52_004328 [Ascosphaera acerosa]|nr:hypothetical protein KEM52_004328 [Ascosphaera acerosa]